MGRNQQQQGPKGFGAPVNQTAATELLRQKGRKLSPGYPIATVAYYGPNEDIATKVAVGIVSKRDDVIDMKHWFLEDGDIRFDDGINRQILDFVKRKRAKRVAITDGIMGCPHEEGIDYPEGEVCPECSYWANRDRMVDIL